MIIHEDIVKFKHQETVRAERSKLKFNKLPRKLVLTYARPDGVNELLVDNLAELAVRPINNEQLERAIELLFNEYLRVSGNELIRLLINCINLTKFPTGVGQHTPLREPTAFGEHLDIFVTAFINYVGQQAVENFNCVKYDVIYDKFVYSKTKCGNLARGYAEVCLKNAIRDLNGV